MPSPIIVKNPEPINVIGELVSALSALHMEDTIATELAPTPDDVHFINEKYEWVAHCQLHIRAAIAMARDMMVVEDAKKHEEWRNSR